jgi:hypothetical protein
MSGQVVFLGFRMMWPNKSRIFVAMRTIPQGIVIVLAADLNNSMFFLAVDARFFFHFKRESLPWIEMEGLMNGRLPAYKRPKLDSE